LKYSKTDHLAVAIIQVQLVTF